MIIIFSGPSTIGKDSIWIKAAEILGYKREIMYTTREKRINEVDGFDYHFVTKKKFKKMIQRKEFVEWDYYFSNYYGIHEDSILSKDNKVLQSITRMAVRAKLKHRNIFVISLIPNDINIINNRLKERKYTSIDLYFRNHHVLEEIDNSFLADKILKGIETISIDESITLLKKIIHENEE